MPDQYDAIIKLAEENGWSVERSFQNGPTFIKGNTRVWQCRDGWQVADLIDGYFKNHRGLKAGLTLKDILENEGD